MWVCACVYVCPQRPVEGGTPELQVSVSHLMWVWKIRFQSSVRVVHTSNCGATSPARGMLKWEVWITHACLAEAPDLLTFLLYVFHCAG